MSYQIDSRELIRRGALARLAELREEVRAIERLLGSRKGRRQSTVASPSAIAPEQSRRKVVWTAAKRKAAADRMRKYWASRRAKR